jgi:hypothetical protein
VIPDPRWRYAIYSLPLISRGDVKTPGKLPPGKKNICQARAPGYNLAVLAVSYSRKTYS